MVTLLGRRSRHAFASLACLGLAYTADPLGHLSLRYSLLDFPNCHVASSLNESGLLAR